MKLSDLRKARDILARTPPSFDHIRQSDKMLWSLAVARMALPMLLEVLETLAQYEDTRHLLRSVMERAGIEADK